MRAKERARQAAEAHVLQHLRARGQEVTVYELARELGYPWQRTIKILRCLVARGQVLVSESERKDGNYRVRQDRKYRAGGWLAGALPAWLSPPVHVVPAGRVVKGAGSPWVSAD